MELKKKDYRNKYEDNDNRFHSKANNGQNFACDQNFEYKFIVYENFAMFAFGLAQMCLGYGISNVALFRHSHAFGLIKCFLMSIAIVYLPEGGTCFLHMILDISVYKEHFHRYLVFHSMVKLNKHSIASSSWLLLTQRQCDELDVCNVQLGLHF